MVEGRSLEELIAKFEQELKDKQRKARTVESYTKSLEQFSLACARHRSEDNVIDQVDKGVMLKFVGWLEKNLENARAAVTRTTPTATS